MNVKSLVLALGIAGVSVLQQVAAAGAANFIDQSQTDNSVIMAAFSQPDLAQSFKTQQNNVSGAGIYLPNFGTPNNITISLWDNLPNAGGKQLATGTKNGVTLGAFNDVFWNPVDVISNQFYYLVFTSDNRQGAVSGSVNNPYSNGDTYANPGYQSFPGFDYTFRTYSDSSKTSVPEPSSTLGVFALGAIGAGATLKRKQQQKATVEA